MRPTTQPASVVPALVVTLVAVALSACASQGAAAPEAEQALHAEDSPVRLVPRRDADLLLWLSNQSFDDPTVVMTVTIDGVRVVEGDFPVEGQHTWYDYPLALDAGRHLLEVETDSGRSTRRWFTIPEGTTRHALLDHWGTGRFSWTFQAQPLAFA